MDGYYYKIKLRLYLYIVLSLTAWKGFSAFQDLKRFNSFLLSH